MAATTFPLCRSFAKSTVSPVLSGLRHVRNLAPGSVTEFGLLRGRRGAASLAEAVRWQSQEIAHFFLSYSRSRGGRQPRRVLGVRSPGRTETCGLRHHGCAELHPVRAQPAPSEGRRFRFKYEVRARWLPFRCRCLHACKQKRCRVQELDLASTSTTKIPQDAAAELRSLSITLRRRARRAIAGTIGGMCPEIAAVLPACRC